MNLTFKKIFLSLLNMEKRQFSKLFATFLFCVSIQIIFHFAIGESTDESILLSQYFFVLIIANFLGTQIFVESLFRPEYEDGVLTQWSLHNKNWSPFLLAKLLILFLQVTLLNLALFSVSAFLSERILAELHFDILATAFILSSIGQCTLGCLLASVTLHTKAPQLLFSILYLPLCLPLLIANIHSLISFHTKLQDASELWQSWFGLMFIFDIVFFTLAFLLTRETLKEDA